METLLTKIMDVKWNVLASCYGKNCHNQINADQAMR